MDYAATKQSIIAEPDFLQLSDRLLDYADRAAAAANLGDIAAMHTFIRLCHWVMFRRADFVMHPLDLPVVDAHTHAIVCDTPVEIFAAAVEMDPPPMSFKEAMALARASRGN